MKKQEVIDNLKKLAFQHKNKKYLTGKEVKRIPKLSIISLFILEHWVML